MNHKEMIQKMFAQMREDFEIPQKTSLDQAVANHVGEGIPLDFLKAALSWDGWLNMTQFYFDENGKITETTHNATGVPFEYDESAPIWDVLDHIVAVSRECHSEFDYTIEYFSTVFVDLMPGDPSELEGGWVCCEERAQ